jgi:hypothetical protein
MAVRWCSNLWTAEMQRRKFIAELGSTAGWPKVAWTQQQPVPVGILGGSCPVDAGGGYTYLDSQSGREFSAVLGFTYNLPNDAMRRCA